MTTFKAQIGVKDVPRDVAVTPNGALAVVRSNDPNGTFPEWNDEITIWRCASGARVTVVNAPLHFGRGRVVAGVASDAMAVTNNWAVVAGGGSPVTGDPDNTYIDVISLSGGPVTCRGSLMFPAPGQTSAGQVNDVAITPSETWAVVHSKNWIHLIDLVTVDGEVPRVIALDIGAIDAGECYPGPQSDSVAMTDSHCVVVTTRDHETPAGGLRPHAWVYIVNLLTEPPSLVQLHPAQGLYGHLLQDSANPEAPTPPHDVGISWYDSLAFVSASQMVALFWLTDPTGPSFVDQQFQPNFTRVYGLQPMPVDSVELTYDRALVLSNEDTGSPTGPRTWALHVFETWKDGAPVLDLLRVYRGSVVGPTITDDPPHDLAVSHHNGIARGVVSTADTDILLPDLHGFAHPDGEIFFLQSWGDPFFQPGNVFVSDSAVIGSTVGPQQWALTIGTSSGGVYRSAQVLAWDILNIHPGHALSRRELSVSDLAHDVIPSDIHPAHYGQDALVRCYAPPDEGDPGAGGRDVLRFYVHSPNPYEASRLGGAGHAILALDSMDVGSNSAASVSERFEADEHGVWGYVHFVKTAFQ